MEKQKIRTAAYCRVSSLSDTQDGSFEAQCTYFEKLIRSDPDMEFAGLYGDHGKSGRVMRNRKELNRMIKDCEKGKIDLILTKSISRFARNMLECVQTLRHLRECGVNVRFERERLDLESMGGELMLSILATIAEEESNSISLNSSWSRTEHVEKGQPWEKARYGFVSVGPEHTWEVVGNEADVIKKAFYMAGMCHTYSEITEEMNRMEAANETGRIWTNPGLVRLLRSEAYIGNYLSNKEIRIVDKKGISRRVKNRGEVNRVLIEGHHQAIVSKELYDAVQELLDHRTLGGHRRNFSSKEKEIMERAMAAAVKEAGLRHK
ncbi:MAG: recombinase family protein [Lachnospiraceae bacterium]|nr:recombinase family protein [Lachnospiraceae bacterium]